MGLLSSPQGRPERVFSLLRLLAAHDGAMSRGDIKNWLTPPSLSEGQSTAQLSQTIQCAMSLGLVESESGASPLRLVSQVFPHGVPSSHESFADLVHRRLCDAPGRSDRIMLAAYSLWVLRCEQARGDHDWVERMSIAEVGADVDKALRELPMLREDTVVADGLDDDANDDTEDGADKRGDARVFNDTKFTPWRAWIVALGLGWQGKGLPPLFAHPTARVGREVVALGRELGFDQPIAPSSFVEALAQRMPYLDGGIVFRAVADHIGHPLPSQLTAVTSAALRELHDAGAIRLESGGDARTALQLARDPSHNLPFFISVTVHREARS